MGRRQHGGVVGGGPGEHHVPTHRREPVPLPYAVDRTVLHDRGRQRRYDSPEQPAQTPRYAIGEPTQVDAGGVGDRRRDHRGKQLAADPGHATGDGRDRRECCGCRVGDHHVGTLQYVGRPLGPDVGVRGDVPLRPVADHCRPSRGAMLALQHLQLGWVAQHVVMGEAGAVVVQGEPLA